MGLGSISPWSPGTDRTASVRHIGHAKIEHPHVEVNALPRCIDHTYSYLPRKICPDRECWLRTQMVTPRASTGGSVQSRTEGSDRIFISTLLVTVEDSISRPQRTAPGVLRTSGNSGQLRVGVRGGGAAVVNATPGIVDPRVPNCHAYLRA